MSFYQLLQLDPFILKQKMKKARSKSDRRKYLLSLILRSFLIVGFAIVMITSSTHLFGESNKAYAIVFFCMLLSLRFVDFGYKISQSILGLILSLLRCLSRHLFSYCPTLFCDYCYISSFRRNINCYH